MPSLLPCFYSSNQFIDNLQPHIQGAGCAGTGGQRGATPHSKSEGGSEWECTLVQGKQQLSLLEQP